MTEQYFSKLLEYENYFCLAWEDPITKQKRYYKNIMGKIRTFKTLKKAQKFAIKKGLHPIYNVVQIDTKQQLTTKIIKHGTY